MSTKDFQTKAIFITFLFFFLILILSFLKQSWVYYHTISNLSQKERAIQALQQRKKALEAKLEEVQSPKFLDKQSREILGVGDATGAAWLSHSSEKAVVYSGEMPPGPSHLQQWLSLFGF